MKNQYNNNYDADNQYDNSNGLELGDMIGLFKKVADNPVSSRILQKTLEYCEKDGSSKLESSLKYYLGKKDDVCFNCKVLSKAVGYIVKKGANSFGMTVDELKEAMADEYWIKGLTSVIKGIALFGVNKPFVPGAPFQIVWNITNACNLRCVHCYEGASVKRKDELSKDQIINSLEVMGEVGVTSIAFSGGEPTIHPNILDFINSAQDNGMFPAIATNGYTLKDKEKASKFVDNGLEFVQISLDGLNPETHDSFRKVNGAWDRAVQSIENFVDMGIFVEVATTVTEHNVDEIPEMIDFLKDIGIDWFMLYNFIPTGNGAEILDLDLSPQERENLLVNAYSKNSDDMQILSTAPQYASVVDNINSNNNNIDDDSNIIPTHFYNAEYSNPMIAQLADFIGGCGAGRFYMNIEPNGDMFPCVFFPHDDDVKLGNIITDDFEYLWANNNTLKQLRNKEILKGHCGVCDSHNICGGCRARAYNYFGDILAPDPGCTHNQKEWDILKSKIVEEKVSVAADSSEDYLILDFNK
ncbi:radical SAM protein [Methanobrevibacter sp. TMH8]|uniref:radical SAM/SPASM domain-containing protein n=1 Tax=Methanobrevibacter sp. TMH8 TaxID=2848611 RepID=UPI001CCEA462|nr:radical SAM protein [Methanobrevibacter sp. TMH8]MBZ9570979.1 radical SAM protein [Methanobrevibacter sp. TMH8]